MKQLAIFLAAALLASCATASLPPGSGWSRAPDLSAWSALVTFGELAREESILCGGFSPTAVRRRWAGDFGAREAAVEAALAARHGVPDVAEARAAGLPRKRVECPDVPNLAWRYRYARLLRLLEFRLGLG